MLDVQAPQLTEAVLVWTGWSREVWPQRSDARVIAHFGVDTASRLLPIIKALEEEFSLSEARLNASDLAEMGRLAAEDFRKKHPGIPDAIVKAFAWCYTFDFK